MRDKVKEFIRNSIGYIMVVLTSCLFIFSKMFMLNPTGKTLGQIIGEGLLAFLMGISINLFFTSQGLINGKNDESMEKTLTLYSKTVETVSKNIHKLGDWCHQKNKNTYKCERTKILARGGLKYEECFSEEGITKPFVFNKEFYPISKDKTKLKNKSTKETENLRIKNLKKLNAEIKEEYKLKKKYYKKAVNLHLTEIYSTDLTSEGGKKNDPNNWGKTIKEYSLISNSKGTFIRAFMAIMFGIYGVEKLVSFSWENLVWSAFEVCVYIVFGIIAMNEAYMFMTNDYRARIIKKIDNLEEFNTDLLKKDILKEEKQDDGRKEKEIAV